MGRTDAPPYLPGASHLYGREAKELALAPVGPATEPSGPVTKLYPLDHLQPIPAAHWTHGGLGGVKFRPLASLFAQLLSYNYNGI